MNKKKIFGIMVLFLVLASAVLAVLRYNDKIAADSPRLYKQGITFFNENDYQNSYYNFSKISKISPLYKMALYRQAQAAERLSNYDLAEEKYAEFLNKFSKSVFASSAKYSLAKAYYYQKKYDKAKEEFLQIKTFSSNSEYSIGANYFLAQIDKVDNPTSAKNFFLEYIKTITTGKYSIACADELLKMNYSLTTNETELVAKVYFDNGQYQKALPLFYKVPIERSWGYLAIANYSLSNKAVAKKQLEAGITKYSNNTDKQILQKAYSLYVDSLKVSSAKAWGELLQLVQNSHSNGEDFVLYKYAQVLSSDKSNIYYSKIIDKYPKSEFAPDSMWNLFFAKYQLKDYQNAKKIATEYMKNYSSSPMTPQMLYWLGKLNLKLGNKQDANSVFSKITMKYPDSYYAFRVSTLADKGKLAWKTNSKIKISNKKYEIDFPIEYSNIDIKDLKLIDTLLKLGDFEVWLEADFGNKAIESWFALKRGQLQRSMVLARDAIEEMPVKPSFDSSIYLLAYPKYYVDIVNQNAIENSLTPYLILALIKEESYFNPQSRSSVNAVGLMQLMPQTADFIASKFSKTKPSIQDLEVPEINLDLGCGYLKFLKTMFEDSELDAVIAYNAGNGNVNKWKQNLNYNDYDEFIEMIPYKESRDYIKKVYRTYYNYTQIYK